jgi:uncharacterized protein
MSYCTAVINSYWSTAAAIVFCPYADYSDREMLDTREEIVQTLTSIAENDPAIELCIIYGSAAADTLTRRSDIDIAVGAEKGLSVQQCIELSRTMTLAVDREVSVIDIKKMEGVILQEVLAKGLTLKNTNVNFKAEFIMKMYGFNEDVLPYQLMGITRKITEYLDE